MKKLIIGTKLIKRKKLGVLLTLLGLSPTPLKNEKVGEVVVNNSEDREKMKLAQLESYLSADDNQGIINLSLYL
ncbi:MAG: hypothetical protein AB4206_04275 [Xenococcaceae cyanobacterium]